MKLNITELYNLYKYTGLEICAKDGGPINSIISAENYMFIINNSNEIFDFDKFYNICLHPCCAYDMIEGDITIITTEDHAWIALDAFTWENNKITHLEFVSLLR